MAAPETIRQLVTRFDEHCESYRSGKYNETQLVGEMESTGKLSDKLVYKLSPKGDDIPQGDNVWVDG